MILKGARTGNSSFKLASELMSASRLIQYYTRQPSSEPRHVSNPNLSRSDDFGWSLRKFASSPGRCRPMIHHLIKQVKCLNIRHLVINS